MIRDRHTCVYCGARKNLNIDHVRPRSRGGRDTFENTVTACVRCNSKKGDRTPDEAGMRYQNRHFSPCRPTVMAFISNYLDSSGITTLLVKAGVY